MMEQLTLRLSDPMFCDVASDADDHLQRLMNAMIEKGERDAALTIKLDIQLIERASPDGKRIMLVPRIDHKIGTTIRSKSETKGTSHYDDFEVVYNKELQEYILCKIEAVSEQTTLSGM